LDEFQEQESNRDNTGNRHTSMKILNREVDDLDKKMKHIIEEMKAKEKKKYLYSNNP